ncbi:MAG: hypothetical protein GX456_13110 [Verrucomicrobia bacterium]|nr:hypothetical protein [Verrucomicrobiota bacterium]
MAPHGIAVVVMSIANSKSLAAAALALITRHVGLYLGQRRRWSQRGIRLACVVVALAGDLVLFIPICPFLVFRR